MAVADLVNATTALVGWHYIIVSLRDDAPVLRAYLIDGGKIAEEPVVLTGR